MYICECICVYVCVKEHWVAEFFLYIVIIFIRTTLFLCFLFVFSFVFNDQRSFSLLFRSYGHTCLSAGNGFSSFFFLLWLHRSIDTHPSPNHYPSSNRTNVKSGVSALSSTSTAFGTAASNNRLDHAGNGHIDEALRQQALAEEEAAMNQYKVSKKFSFFYLKY